MIAIISDIHGNFPALKQVIAEIDRLGCEDIFSLGDVGGYYCMVNESIELLRGRGIQHLLGNHDFYLLNNLPCPRSTSASFCLEFQGRRVAKENRHWLRGALRSLNRGEISMVHGGWNDFLDEYLYDAREDYFQALEGKIFFSGHTHIQQLVQFAEKTYCNPGSVGQPRDGDPRAAFAVVSEGSIFLKRVEYDIDAIAFEMKKNGFAALYYENLYHGVKINDRSLHAREM